MCKLFSKYFTLFYVFKYIFSVFGEYIISMKKYLLLFLIGGVGYGTLEILWRGYTHWSMIIAGGICFTLFSVISDIFEGSNLFIKSVIAALTITSIELWFGVTFNIILGMDVWDYGNIPLNFLGQICLRFSLLWLLLSSLFLPLAEKVSRLFEKNSARQS